MMGSVSQPPHPDKGDELRDLMQRFMAALAEFSQHFPFDVGFQVPDLLASLKFRLYFDFISIHFFLSDHLILCYHGETIS